MEALKRNIARFDALTLRERLLILVTLVVALSLPALLYLIEPMQKAQLRLTTQLAKLEAENAQAVLELATVKAEQKADPNIALNQQLNQLQQQLERLNQQLSSQSAKLVSPQQMLAQLEQLLAAQTNLKLLSLSKGVPQRLSVGGSEAPASAGGIYRHDLRLVVEGGFFAVLAYLEALEGLPQGFFWDGLDYQVEAYPRARVTLEVHTLSTTEGWLGV